MTLELPSSSSPRAAAPPGGDGPDLAALGSESETERAVKRIVPWVVSAGLHVGMILLGFLLTWTVVMLQRDEEPVLIVADFDQVTYDPVSRMNQEQEETVTEAVQDRVEVETFEDRLEEAEIEVDPLRLMSGAPAEADLARFAPDPATATATFVGLSSTNARRIIYVIDASGSMIASLPIVLDELARSLDGLLPEQEFTVIFFSGNRAIMVPPEAHLHPGTDAEKVRVLTWIDDQVIPAGRSNPLAAIDRALHFHPDVIFLLSTNITGSDEFEIDKKDLLALLDDLNPVIDAETGRRATRINCVQFLDPDPLGTLKDIAERHGGPKGYKFLDREELGLIAR